MSARNKLARKRTRSTLFAKDRVGEAPVTTGLDVRVGRHHVNLSVHRLSLASGHQKDRVDQVRRSVPPEFAPVPVDLPHKVVAPRRRDLVDFPMGLRPELLNFLQDVGRRRSPRRASRCCLPRDVLYRRIAGGRIQSNRRSPDSACRGLQRSGRSGHSSLSPSRGRLPGRRDDTRGWRQNSVSEIPDINAYVALVAAGSVQFYP